MLELYDAILARRSVRRYERTLLPEPILNQVRRAVEGIDALDPGRPFSCTVQAVTAGDDIAAAMGGYGRLLSIPHIIVPAIAEGPNSLTDFGYRVQQVVIRLTRLGLGSCWIGALTHKATAMARFNVPAGMVVAAIVAFGRPATSGAGRALNAVIRSAAGATRKKPASEFTWQDTVGNPAAPTGLQTKVLEALRASPSTGNAQPWCIVLSGGLLYLAVRTDARYYRMSGNVGYDQVDAGIGMANVALALAALGRPQQWTLLTDDHRLRIELALPDSFRLIASITLPV
jgi:nitroreductase